MASERVKKLAKLLVDYSTKVKKGDRVQIDANAIAEPLVKEVYRLCLQKGAFVTVKIKFSGMDRIFYEHASDAQLKEFPKSEIDKIKNTDVYIAIQGITNTRELSSIDPKKISVRNSAVEPHRQIRLKKRWVICDYPTEALAMEADMGLEEYKNFLYRACNVDYKKMEKKYAKIKKLIDAGKTMRIMGENTDIRFRINGMIGYNKQGDKNVPDGEVFTAPEKTKTEGYIEFSYPAIRSGVEVEGIRLEFKKGKVVKATARKNEKFLKQMINSDAGSSYLGEIGIGVNYNIDKYTKNLLFDEKIGGTIHLALGMAYPECCDWNKKELNKSALHWDIVKDLRKKGEIWIDDKLVQKNGKFLV